MSRILGSSSRVSVNNDSGTREGQTLPGVRTMMFCDRRWDENYRVDWDFVKRVWMEHWDTSRPILLEKSPPNILRARQIEEVFQPASFIILVRDPYAHCESQMRRVGVTAGQAAHFAVKCLQWQQYNSMHIGHRLLVTYESMADDPRSMAVAARKFLPGLGRLKIRDSYDVHNSMEKPLGITNLNSRNIGRLSEPDIQEINSVLQKHRDLIEYFGYALGTPQHHSTSAA